MIRFPDNETIFAIDSKEISGGVGMVRSACRMIWQVVGLLPNHDTSSDSRPRGEWIPTHSELINSGFYSVHAVDQISS